jgi:hypothetical protein
MYDNSDIIYSSEPKFLALIGPGEVKVDLADFDLKLQENLLSTLYFVFDLFLQKRLPDLFKLLT